MGDWLWGRRAPKKRPQLGGTEAVLVRGFRANGSQYAWLSRQSGDGFKDGLASVYTSVMFYRCSPPGSTPWNYGDFNAQFSRLVVTLGNGHGALSCDHVDLSMLPKRKRGAGAVFSGPNLRTQHLRIRQVSRLFPIAPGEQIDR